MIYNKCAGQFIMGLSGPIALCQGAVIERLDLLDIPGKDRDQLLDDVMLIAQKVIEEGRKDESKKRRKAGESQG